MTEIFGVPTQALFGQLLIGLINGSFYALLSLGLAVIFGLLNIINFTHGAQYMMGAFVAWFLLNKAGLGYWWALVLAPIAVGLFGAIIERTMLKRLYKLDHLYGLLLTFGLALIIQGLFRNEYGSRGLPYSIPSQLQGGQDPGLIFLRNYRAWVIVLSLVVCLTTWFVIEKTKLGSYLRAATENPELVRAFGINVPRMITLTYGFGVGLAALAGVMAAPIYSVNPLMGADLIIVVLALCVLGPLRLSLVFRSRLSCFPVFACAFILLIGFVGLLSFGHAMSLGTAGYVCAYPAKVWGVAPELAVLAATAASCVLVIVT